MAQWFGRVSFGCLAVIAPDTYLSSHVLVLGTVVKGCSSSVVFQTHHLFRWVCVSTILTSAYVDLIVFCGFLVHRIVKVDSIGVL